MGQNVSFDELYHRCFNITSIRNSPHLFVLPSHPITHPHFSLKYEAFNIQCDDIFSSVFIPIHILSYQPSCYSCLHLATPYSYQYISCLISRPVTAVYTSQLRIHTDTYPVLSAVLLQLFTPRNSVFIPIHILSYQPSCYSCLHLANPYSYQYISCLISRPVTAVYTSQLRIHTNTYHVLSVVLLQLFTARNYLTLCGRKHFASAM